MAGLAGKAGIPAIVIERRNNMKNRYFLSMMAVLAGLGAYAQLPGRADSEVEGLMFSYCGNYDTSIGPSFGSGTTQSAAIQLTEEEALKWKDNSITKVNIGFGYSKQKEVTVFLTYALGDAPFYTQKAVMETQQGWNSVVLDTPYVIEGKEFFVGYSVAGTDSNDKAIGIDNIPTDLRVGDYANLYDTWEHIGKFYGNVCLRFFMTGENLPDYEAEASELELPQLVVAGEPFAATLYVTNNGVKTITSIDVDCEINGEPVSGFTADIIGGSIVSGDLGEVVLSGLVCNKLGSNIPVSATILKVNGQPDDGPEDNTASGVINGAEKIFKKNVVVEEFTGTWCGNCPEGIVGMAYMREKYGDDGFIGIAGHYGDEMQVSSYANFVDIESAGRYPGSVVDRKVYSYPAAENLEYYYLMYSKYPVGAGVSLTAEYSEAENVIKVKSSTEFSLDQEKAAYKLAFILIEDNFGPYIQENYFAGGMQGYLEGWSNKPREVVHFFDEVVREANTAYGISGSIPSSVSHGVVYEYQTELSMQNVENLNECEVVALLLDTNSGEIVNAAKVKVDNAESGVEGIDNEVVTSYRVYNLNGVKVLETKDFTEVKKLSAGIYIINGKKVKL